MKNSTVKSRTTRTRGESRKTLFRFLDAVRSASALSASGFASVADNITTAVTSANLRKDICKKTLEEFGLIQSSGDGKRYKWQDLTTEVSSELVLDFTVFLNARRNASRNGKRTISRASLPLTGTTMSFVPCETQLSMEFDSLLSNCADVLVDEQPVLNLNKKYIDQLGFVRDIIDTATGKIELQLQANRIRIDYLTEEIKKLGVDNRELQTKITENRQILADLDKYERARFCLEYGRGEYKRRYSEDFDMSLAKYADMDLSAYI